MTWLAGDLAALDTTRPGNTGTWEFMMNNRDVIRLYHALRTQLTLPDNSPDPRFLNPHDIDMFSRITCAYLHVMGTHDDSCPL